MNAIEIKNLSKHYQGFSLENLNLILPSGCIMGLVGENGAGKSTTIRMILGMTKPDSGEITVFGRKLTRELKEQIGVVLDEPGYPGCMTAAQIGNMLSGIFRGWEQDSFEGNLTKLHIPDNKPFKDFSMGMKMKLCLAAAMSHGAKLLILDEGIFIQKLVLLPAEHQLSPVQECDVIADLLQIADNMAGNQHRMPLVPGKFVKHIQQLVPHHRIQARGSFVQDQQLCAMAHGCSQR